MDDQQHDRVRIDKWLWAARFFKTRSLATEAVELGRVLINTDRVKPARTVRLGDTILVRRGEEMMTVTVLGISDTRGPAPIAQQLYAETAESILLREARKEQARYLAGDGYQGKGRPTKRDRRQLTRFEGS
ncbi:ribosome-associated heat shock protein Hsp15 [Chitinivorax tropicus]|uniref:Ribosome-associated heat shock protein Hsp15 n=1 Tax=Chitinivorax tropicus TaxID=714531 RepID=A0A840MLW7_9PROT|nr:RNA-binding S4 domain-containing protein [Chitinivorax tropicus]MBB5017526.1 ribosome-associated heat shock protein Hsp15 [Chitinivorax tropicus]